MESNKPEQLDGKSLTLEGLSRIARGTKVSVGDAAFDSMADRNMRLLAAAFSGKPIYGVTTGLGSKVTQSLSSKEINEFSLNTIRGRAHAIGLPLPKDVVRAAMAIRLNTLLIGASGASPAIAERIHACLNADLVPHIGETTSTGPADLMWGGNLGLTLVGEGRFLGQSVGEMSDKSIKAEGIAPLTLGPRDGLALVSHSSFTAAFAALATHQAKGLWDWAQSSAAMTLEGFRANLSPFRAEVLALRPQAGAEKAGREILSRLEGSALLKAGHARRLQDPLSLRNIAQVHGSLFEALSGLEESVLADLNGATDSPVLLDQTEEIVSSGNFLNPYIGVALVAANFAMVQLAAQVASRIARMLADRFTGLPSGLNLAAPGNAGFGPVSKVSEALFAEVSQLATPPPIYPSSSADGVEDIINYAALSGRALMGINERMASLIAIELMVAVQAIELRDGLSGLPVRLKGTVEFVRKISPKLEADRPLGAEIEALAEALLARRAVS